MSVTAYAPVDDFQLNWGSFSSFFLARSDLDSSFLIEIDHESGTRTEWTVAEWRDRVLAVAGWLTAQGVRPGAPVATLAGNTAEALAVAYASWVLGACCVPLNPADPPERQAYILRDADAVLLVHSPAAADVARGLSAATGTPLSAAPARSLPQAGGVPDRAGRRQDDGQPALGLDVPALRVYTSGTTGDPKGVVLTAANLLIDCHALSTGLDWEPGTRILTVLPIHHVNGLIVSSLLPWFAGLSTVLCDRFRSERFWPDVAAEQASVCSVVPSLLEFLLAVAGSAPAGFREFLCGAGPLLVETALNFEDRFGVPIRHLYGLSETTAVVTLMPRLAGSDRRRWHREYGFPSVGPALPHAEVAVLTANGARTDAGIRGELAIRGAVVMQEYAAKPEATEQAFLGGWLHSGDEGFWESGPDGRPYFFITGRLKELIIRGGSNISPFEVDAVLHSHPAVRHGFSVPFENRFYGEEIAAYVVADGEVTAEEILAHCERYLGYAKSPKVIVFGNDIPYTATGKVKRLDIKNQLSTTLAEYRDVQFRKSS